jgi:hypothetical protein
MVADGVTFLFQGQLRYGRACHLGLIVSKYIRVQSMGSPSCKAYSNVLAAFQKTLLNKSLNIYNVKRTMFCLSSIPCFIAMNSAPKTEVSMVACFLETQSIKAILQKIRKPVRERLVLLSPAWSLSHIMRTSRSLPKGSGMSTGIASSTLP